MSNKYEFTYHIEVAETGDCSDYFGMTYEQATSLAAELNSGEDLFTYVVVLDVGCLK